MADRLFIVRHGETEWSRSGQHTSHTDLPLTKHGIEQGEVVGRKLSGESFEMVLCSPLSRARETCRLAGFADAAEIDDEPARMGLRRLRGTHDAPDPPAAARLVAVA